MKEYIIIEDSAWAVNTFIVKANNKEEALIKAYGTSNPIYDKSKTEIIVEEKN